MAFNPLVYGSSAGIVCRSNNVWDRSFSSCFSYEVVLCSVCQKKKKKYFVLPKITYWKRHDFLHKYTEPNRHRVFFVTVMSFGPLRRKENSMFIYNLERSINHMLHKLFTLLLLVFFFF